MKAFSIGDIVHRKRTAYEEYLNRNGKVKVPRKLKKRLKKIDLGVTVRIVNIVKS